jgi:hypothetical protein
VNHHDPGFTHKGELQTIPNTTLLDANIGRGHHALLVERWDGKQGLPSITDSDHHAPGPARASFANNYQWNAGQPEFLP